MESIIARALEYTLKYWLKSFSRDQFKLQGHTAQLSNLDINGDALHASVGFPPALNVTTSKVGKLEITLPSLSHVQIEPIVVQVDRLDLVLEENVDAGDIKNLESTQPSTASGKGSGYGYADKIADGMTLQVGIVNLLLETRGGSRQQGGGATWASPLASVTIRNLLLYTTNENWQVVNLKEARDFSNGKKCIYVFKKLEWESLSVDLLPHPDMFSDSRFSNSDQESSRDDDGAKRLFFGGERFLEGVSGQAYITVKRTEQNSPLGLEVQLRIPEAVCPSLSEPGLRAFLRFMTGLYVCLNRGDVDPMARQNSTETAGLSLVSIIVDHIFLCIKDSEFQLELLMQSLFFSRSSISDGERTKQLSRVMVGGLFLRDTFSRPPCTLIQPSMYDLKEQLLSVPEFGENFCPAIYPLGDQLWQIDMHPLICIHSLQTNPTPTPPLLASQTVIHCQPLLVNLHEESCLRITSFLADGIVVNPGAVLPDFSVNSFVLNLKAFDLTVPLDSGRFSDITGVEKYPSEIGFSGARLGLKNLVFSQSPSLKCSLLNLDKDPVCFSFWPYQPIDASQKKWTTQASYISLSLETYNELAAQKKHSDFSLDLWTCVEVQDMCFEAAMVTCDGTPLMTLPPPDGIVRIGVSFKQCVSNTSVEQLFFVLDLYSYFGRVSEKISKIGKSYKQSKDESLKEQIIEKAPSDTSVCLTLNELELKFLESSLHDVQGMPLVQFDAEDLFVKVTHRSLGGAFAVSTSLTWDSVQVDCVGTDGLLAHENGIEPSINHELQENKNGFPHMRAVFWTDNQRKYLKKTHPFLELSMIHVMPYNVKDMECHCLTVSSKISGVRLGGGMNYTEALLHRFGILGEDGGPGEGLLKGIKHLSSGPLANLFKSSHLITVNQEKGGCLENEDFLGLSELGKPDDIDVCIELKDWLFALEGTQDIGEERLYYNVNGTKREERFWHTTFKVLQLRFKSKPQKSDRPRIPEMHNYPTESIKVSVEGLQALKPRNDILHSNALLKEKSLSNSQIPNTVENGSDNGGINLETSMVIARNEKNLDTTSWAVENIKFSVKDPIEAVATKEELEQLLFLCRSEVDSIGRIAAGIIRIFKLEESFGKGAINQLRSLGTDSLDQFLSPKKLSSENSNRVINLSDSNITNGSLHHNLDATVSSLEAVLFESQEKCATLVVELNNPDISRQHLADIKQLNQNLESLQVLVTKLRTQI